MKIKYHLTTDDTPKMVGRQSFNYFLEAVEKHCGYFQDDLSLASMNKRYKVFTGRVKAENRGDFMNILNEYPSLDIMKYWIDKSPETYDVIPYYSPYFKNNKWLMDYGVVINSNLYVCGRFNLNTSVINNFPKNKLLSEFELQFSKTDLRTHYLLERIKYDMYFLDLGPCKKNYPVIYNNIVSVELYDLGTWIFDMGVRSWAEGEADKYGKLFQEWVKDKKWASMVKLGLTPGKNGKAEFRVIPNWSV